MNLIPRPLADWFRGVRHRFFFAALRVTIEEEAADLEAESIAIKKKRLTQALEALDWAKQLPTDDGDEHKAKVLADFREDILDIRSVTADVFSGRIPPEEAREALRQLPPVAGDSQESSPAEPKAITQRPSSPGEPSLQPAKKPGRGRPSNEELARRKAQAEAANGQAPHHQGT